MDGPVLTDTDFYAIVVNQLQDIKVLLTAILYGVCFMAAAGTFQNLLYAARNSKFWG